MPAALAGITAGAQAEPRGAAGKNSRADLDLGSCREAQIAAALAWIGAPARPLSREAPQAF
jgi:hypothetical protein